MAEDKNICIIDDSMEDMLAVYQSDISLKVFTDHVVNPAHLFDSLRPERSCGLDDLEINSTGWVTRERHEISSL